MGPLYVASGDRNCGDFSHLSKKDSSLLNCGSTEILADNSPLIKLI